VCYWPAVPAATAADVTALAAAAPPPAAPGAAAAPPPPPAIEVGLEADSGHLVAIAVRGGPGAVGDPAAGGPERVSGSPNSARLPLDLRELDVEAALLRAAEANAALQLGSPGCAATWPRLRGHQAARVARSAGAQVSTPGAHFAPVPPVLTRQHCQAASSLDVRGSLCSRRADRRPAHLRVAACTLRRPRLSRARAMSRAGMRAGALEAVIRRKGHIVGNAGAARLVLPPLPPPPAAAGAGAHAGKGGGARADAAGPASRDPGAGTAPAPDERGGAAAAAGAGGPALELLRGEERLLVVTVHLRTGRLLLAAGAAQGAEVGAECTAALRKARPAVPHLRAPQSPSGRSGGALAGRRRQVAAPLLAACAPRCPPRGAGRTPPAPHLHPCSQGAGSCFN